MAVKQTFKRGDRVRVCVGGTPDRGRIGVVISNYAETGFPLVDGARVQYSDGQPTRDPGVASDAGGSSRDWGSGCLERI